MRLKQPAQPKGLSLSIASLHTFRLFRARIITSGGVSATGIFIKVFNNSGDYLIIRMDHGSGHDMHTIYAELDQSDLVLRNRDIFEITNIVYLDADIVITGEAKE
jgi:hypothetical protein